MKISLNAIVRIMRAFLSRLLPLPVCVWVSVFVQATWINCAMHFCADENHKMASTLVTSNANVVRTQLQIENAAFLFIVFIIMNASIFVLVGCFLDKLNTALFVFVSIMLYRYYGCRLFSFCPSIHWMHI